MYETIDGYWKVQLACIAMLIILFVVISQTSPADPTLREGDDTPIHTDTDRMNTHL